MKSNNQWFLTEAGSKLIAQNGWYSQLWDEIKNANNLRRKTAELKKTSGKNDKPSKQTIEEIHKMIDSFIIQGKKDEAISCYEYLRKTL